MKYINWLYFAQTKSIIDQKKTLYFLYGLTLPTKNTNDLIKEYSRTLPGNKNKLVCIEFISQTPLKIEDKIDFSQLTQIKEFKKYEQMLNNLDILYESTTIQISKGVNEKIPPSFISLPLPIKSFFTSSFNNYYEDILINKNSDFLIKLIEQLEKESNRPFTSTYSPRIGTYEIGETKEWMEELTSPCYLSTRITDREKMLRPYILKKHEKFINESFTIHLIVYNNFNEIIYDEINTINEKEKELFLCCFNPDDDSSIDYWIYDKKNNLIAREKNFYIKGISLNIGMVNNTYSFPANSFSKKSQLSKQDHAVTPIHYNKSEINYTIEKTKHNTKFLSDLIKKHYKKDSEDTGKFFVRNKDNAFEKLKNFFNEITQNGSFHLVIIDPFISQTSLEYLRLISNLNIELTLISCWDKNTSPDGIEGVNIEASINKTCKELEQLKDFNIPLAGTKWFNLKSSKFHDRYIYLFNKETSNINLYIMSNSLNNMLTNYENLLILPLKESVKEDAKQYIEQLITYCNENTQIYPRNVQ